MRRGGRDEAEVARGDSRSMSPGMMASLRTTEIPDLNG